MDSRDSKFEIRHLRVLRALLAESSVSRAADALGQSQPAVSATLRQLRDVFGDPLLVRSGAGMVRTERAEAIAAQVEAVLEGVDSLLEPPGEFDPETATRQVRIIAYLGLGSLLVPALVRALRAEAPGIRLEILQPGTPDVIKQQLQDGEVDLVIANRQEPFQNLRFAPLIECDIACIVSASHPLAGRGEIDLDTYLSLDHISPSPAALVSGAPIDGRLADLGLKRRVAVTVPEYALARYIVPGSNLVFTTAWPYAEDMAASLPVEILKAPPELGRMNAYSFWHEKSLQSAFGRWLRGTVRRVAERLFKG